MPSGLLIFIIIIRNIRRCLDLNIRLCQDRIVFLGKRKSPHRHYALSTLQSFRDLHIVPVADADRHLLLLRLIVGIENDD